MLRDSILAVSGTLNLEPYGPAFKPPISKEAQIARNLKFAVSAGRRRTRPQPEMADGGHARGPAEADLLARIQSFELAFRMQTKTAEAVDLSKETEQTRTMYGLDNPQSRSFGTKCLMARRKPAPS